MFLCRDRVGNGKEVLCRDRVILFRDRVAKGRGLVLRQGILCCDIRFQAREIFYSDRVSPSRKNFCRNRGLYVMIERATTKTLYPARQAFGAHDRDLRMTETCAQQWDFVVIEISLSRQTRTVTLEKKKRPLIFGAFQSWYHILGFRSNMGVVGYELPLKR